MQGYFLRKYFFISRLTCTAQRSHQVSSGEVTVMVKGQISTGNVIFFYKVTMVSYAILTSFIGPDKWVDPCENMSCLRAGAESKGSDQPMRLRSLTRAFTVCLQNHWILQNV